MQENGFKKKFYTIISILIALVVVGYLFSYISKVKKERAEEEAYQRMLAEEEARQEQEARKELILYLAGKFDPAKKEEFILIPKKYALYDRSMYLRKEAYSAFLSMESAARADGIQLLILSATRNFESQKELWESKWSGTKLVDGNNLSKNIADGLTRFKKILEYSAAPGTSRHHWGTDIDINDADPKYFETEQGRKEYEWLKANAPEFGFCQPYNSRESGRVKGYNEEKWHWSYLPLALDFTRAYKELMKEENITGFLGDQFVPEQSLIEDYVLSINPECL